MPPGLVDTAPRKAYRPRSKGTCRIYTPPFKDNRRCIQAEEALHAAALPEAKCGGHQVCLRVPLTSRLRNHMLSAQAHRKVTDVDGSPEHVTDGERRISEALSALRHCAPGEHSQARSRVLREIHDWSVASGRTGAPVAASTLDELTHQINNILCHDGVRRACVVRAGQRLHLATGLRFH